jgi:hypothetical protein
MLSGGKTSHSWVRRNCHREIRRTMLSSGKTSHSWVRRNCHKSVRRTMYVSVGKRNCHWEVRRTMSQRWVGENVAGLGQEKNVTKVSRRKCDRAVSREARETGTIFPLTFAKSGTQKDLLLAEDR